MTAITFRASFPAIQSAIKRSGGGDGMRIQLDIPEAEMAQAVHLLAMTNAVLRVTVEIAPEEAPNASRPVDYRPAPEPVAGENGRGA